jgi:phage tail-like protein
MATARPNNNPYSNFNFTVSINGSVAAAFQEVSGLDSENTLIEYREGGDAFNTVRKLPGIEKYPHLMLKRGVTGDLLLWQWRQEVRDGGTAFPPVRNVVIQLQNEQHVSVYKWTLTNAWCTKLSGPSLKGQGNEIAIETMELAYDRIDLS